jgi:hypothetical protein
MFRIFAIDTEGNWVEENSPEQLAESCEFIDIQNNEYVVIDENGILYEWNKSNKFRSGFLPTPTQRTNPELIQKILRTTVAND